MPPGSDCLVEHDNSIWYRSLWNERRDACHQDDRACQPAGAPLPGGPDRGSRHTEIEAHLIARLAARGPCSVAEVQQAFGLRRSTLTNALDRLEHKGLLTRQLHPADRRTFLLELTTAGREAAGRVTGVVDLLEEHVRTRVSAGQLDAFHSVMAVLEEVLP